METLKSTRFKITLEEEKLINDYCETQKRSFAFVVQLAVEQFAERLKEEIKAKATPPPKQEVKAKVATTPKKKKPTVKSKAVSSQQTILPTKNEAEEIKE
jgi:hypothetical protein